MNPENKCEHLFDDDIDVSDVTMDKLFDMQLKLQQNLASKGRAVDPISASFKEKVDDITKQWRNMNLEMAELLERLPFKEWKTYEDNELSGYESEEQMLEIWYEYIDVLHFFLNVGLNLGLDGDTVKKLYVTKNKENFDRQKRGY